MVRRLLLSLTVLLLSCDFYGELEVQLYVDSTYTSLGNNYVTIRYDYTPGYNTIAKVDLYRYDQNPFPYENEYIKTYTLSPGNNMVLELEDADFRLMNTTEDIQGFRLEVVPMQSRAGEESPFNFFQGDNYLFRIDHRTDLNSLITDGALSMEPNLVSQLLLDNFQGDNWVQKHGQVFFNINVEQDNGGFDSFDYHYDYSGAGTASLEDPFEDHPIIPVSDPIGHLHVIAANPMRAFTTVYDGAFDFQTGTDTNFHYEALPDIVAPIDYAPSYLEFTGIIPQTISGGSYRMRSGGPESAGIWWSTIPYYMIDGQKYLPEFYHYEDAGNVYIEYSFSLPADSGGKNLDVFLSNPYPNLSSLPENLAIPNSIQVFSDVIDDP